MNFIFNFSSYLSQIKYNNIINMSYVDILISFWSVVNGVFLIGLEHRENVIKRKNYDRSQTIYFRRRARIIMDRY